MLKKRYRGSKDEERSLQDKILDRLETELHGAYNAIEMSIHSQQLNESKTQSLKMDADTQTTIKNIHQKIIQE